ncbi:hypothetical protein B0O80DRAFT_103522 [Mortierella sp. GBAus27b]|nr:hypothetical protein BGX31_008578 [Mortierella sp. GBA43]KAI8351835.1 hypothetical protein B0O80DRAFT_103522 [Mortierella sp. GBAus27b]
MGRPYQAYQGPSERTCTETNETSTSTSRPTSPSLSSSSSSSSISVSSEAEEEDTVIGLHLRFLDLVRGKFEELIRIRSSLSMTDRMYGQINELFARVEENLAGDELPYSVEWRRVLRRMDEIIWSMLNRSFSALYIQRQQMQRQRLQEQDEQTWQQQQQQQLLVQQQHQHQHQEHQDHEHQHQHQHQYQQQQQWGASTSCNGIL